jgi:hypothetical protein
VEQAHRFIKRLVKPGLGFGSFETAWQTLQGYEVMHLMRKGQVQGVEKGTCKGQVTFIASLFGVVASAEQAERLHAHDGPPRFFATEPHKLLSSGLRSQPGV